MPPINIAAIEQDARRLRAEELQRIEGIFSERFALYGRLLAATALSGVIALSELLRPLFAWNPRAESYPTLVAIRGPALLLRANTLARGMFSWNPRAKRSY